MCPPLVKYDTSLEYESHYINNYCKQKIYTFDGIRIYFPRNKFSHAFYESSNRRGNKDTFSEDRSKRIDWIKHTLENSSASLFKGWNKKEKKYTSNSRVNFVYENFVVIIQLKIKNGILSGTFITCYQANNSINKIKASPLWDKNECINSLTKLK